MRYTDKGRKMLEEQKEHNEKLGTYGQCAESLTYTGVEAKEIGSIENLQLLTRSENPSKREWN